MGEPLPQTLWRSNITRINSRHINIKFRRRVWRFMYPKIAFPISYHWTHGFITLATLFQILKRCQKMELLKLWIEVSSLTLHISYVIDVFAVIKKSTNLKVIYPFLMMILNDFCKAYPLSGNNCQYFSVFRKCKK